MTTRTRRRGTGQRIGQVRAVESRPAGGQRVAELVPKRAVGQLGRQHETTIEHPGAEGCEQVRVTGRPENGQAVWVDRVSAFREPNELQRDGKPELNRKSVCRCADGKLQNFLPTVG